MAESPYSNQMQRELEEAYREEKQRLDQLHHEVDRLSRFSSRGSKVNRTITIASSVVLALLFIAISWIMLTDPMSARAWPFLVVMLAGGGYVLYVRRSKA